MVRRCSSALLRARSFRLPPPRRVDHLRSVELCANALQVACGLLASISCSASATGSRATVAAAGTFVTKLWAGGEQQQLLAEMRSRCDIFPLPPSCFTPKLAVLHIRRVCAASPPSSPASHPPLAQRVLRCFSFVKGSNRNASHECGVLKAMSCCGILLASHLLPHTRKSVAHET